ncbi:MAG: extracellular solute-binding protein [Candidatus Uhrbacteria bacterium]
MYQRLLSFLLLFVLILPTFGAGCGTSTAEKEANLPVTLKAWCVFEDSAAFNGTMAAYQKIHKNVSFDFRVLRYDEYEDELLQAFARGEGPDIFSVPSTWIGEYKDLIIPLPATLTIPYSETTGTIKKETVTVLREEKAITEQELKNNFVDVVYNDVVRDYQSSPNSEFQKRIFAIPLYVDTLALYSNTELLNTANIAEPPKTWQEFQDQVKTLTKVDANGKVVQSAAAIGTGANVERASDILSVLMLQGGATMEKNNSSATFAEEPEKRTPGADAIRFYTDFANPVKDVYTWTKEMSDSFEAFANEETTFFFGYSYHQPLFNAQAPKLEYRITPLPQIENGKVVNFANYWVWLVSKATPNSKWAWDFLQFAAKKENVQTYLDTSNRPTALRSLINIQNEDPAVSVFVSQLLTAESWYHGKDANVVEEAFISLIDNALVTDSLSKIIKEAQNKVNQTY